MRRSSSASPSAAGIVPLSLTCRLPKLRIGGLHQKKAPAGLSIGFQQGLPRADRIWRKGRPYSGSYPAQAQKKAPPVKWDKPTGLKIARRKAKTARGRR
jgi:hypothetical protein